jgi:hypothetical protein
MLFGCTYSLFLILTGSSEIFDDDQLAAMADHGWTVFPENEMATIVDDPEVDKMYEGYCGPSQDVMKAAQSPLSLFFYFLPKAFWRHVAVETHRYWDQTFEARLASAEAKESGVTHRPQKTSAKLRRRLQRYEKISPHEIVQWIGLIMAHTLNPRKGFEMHWNVAEDGVIPAGTFAKVMPRDRFREIARFLHLSNNRDPAAARDRAWKIRPVLSTLERTFKQGYVLGSRVAIDEGMLPSRNRRNPTRTYMKDKPHKWDSKCVMTCCADTGYCKR